MTVSIWAYNKTETSIVNKLNGLHNLSTFWDDVRKFTAKVKTDAAIHRWEHFSEQRYAELLTGTEDVRIEVDYGKPTRYYDRDWNEVFPKECD